MTTISVDPNLDRAQRKVSTANLANFSGVDCQLLVVKETHRPVVMDGKTPGGVFETASLKELNAVKTELTEAIGTKQPTGNYLTKEDAASTYVKKTDKVTSAATADKAIQADSATNATNAATADVAVKATQDGSGNVIVTTYAKKTELSQYAKSVNGSTPDGSGNVVISFATEEEAKGGTENTKPMTALRVKQVIDQIEHVKSINGVKPDDAGNIVVDTSGVKTVNGNSPDEAGNIAPGQTGCLPLAGGTMSGAISFASGVVSFRNDDSYKEVQFVADTNGKFGAGLFLRTGDSQATDGPGSFLLATRGNANSSDLGPGLIGKANGELHWNGGPVGTIVESWRDGTNFYRKWSDGFVEQGGSVIRPNSSTEMTLYFHKPFSSASSYVIVKNVGTKDSAGSSFAWYGFFDYAANSAKTYEQSNYNSRWYAFGY